MHNTKETRRRHVLYPMRISAYVTGRKDMLIVEIWDARPGKHQFVAKEITYLN